MAHPPRPAQSRLLIALLLVALGMRALVPDGFMPANGELVELCTEHGLQRLLVDTGTGEILGEEDGTATSACPWSVMLTTLAPPALPAASGQLILTHETPPSSTLPQPARERPLLPPARAPPRLA